MKEKNCELVARRRTMTRVKLERGRLDRRTIIGRLDIVFGIV